MSKKQALKVKWDNSWGPKPTNQQIRVVEECGLARADTKTAFALAMMLREDGASQVQIKEALGSTYRNRAAQLEERGLITLHERKINGQIHYRMVVLPREELTEAPEVVEERAVVEERVAAE